MSEYKHIHTYVLVASIMHYDRCLYGLLHCGRHLQHASIASLSHRHHRRAGTSGPQVSKSAHRRTRIVIGSTAGSTARYSARRTRSSLVAAGTISTPRSHRSARLDRTTLAPSSHIMHASHFHRKHTAHSHIASDNTQHTSSHPPAYLSTSTSPSTRRLVEGLC